MGEKSKRWYVDSRLRRSEGWVGASVIKNPRNKTPFVCSHSTLKISSSEKTPNQKLIFPQRRTAGSLKGKCRIVKRQLTGSGFTGSPCQIVNNTPPKRLENPNQLGMIGTTPTGWSTPDFHF